jgi:hypothetical protein
MLDATYHARECVNLLEDVNDRLSSKCIFNVGHWTRCVIDNGAFPVVWNFILDRTALSVELVLKDTLMA